ncbi:MAG: hypothetical protein ABIR71_02765 [Chthoniobacterales bacterium]
MENSVGGSRTITSAVLVLATLVAWLGAQPFAGGWNDGSRLATVESLVDYGTWAIDDSIFVEPARARGAPYAADARAVERGTQDKLLIGGRYYSDKSPVPALFMAGVYQLLQWTTGLVAREEPARFCHLLTLFSSGLAYVTAVWGIARLASSLGTAMRLLVSGSFAFATVALTYARQVNSHILLLAVCVLLLVRLTPRTRAQLMAAGTLIGFGYTLDLGLGPILVLSTAGLIGYRTRRWSSVAWLLGAALPWFALHHYLNWRIGGTFTPANVQAAYLAWPGSPFGVANMTGRWAHDSVGQFFLYALDLLFGKRGFIGHNLALYLALPGALVLARRRVRETPEIVWAVVFFIGSWLVYAFTSTNYSGVCASIRWFVPLLAPAYYLLIVLLREVPRHRAELFILTFFGAIIGLLMWWKGPWMTRMVPGFWFIQGATLMTWLWYRFAARNRRSKMG